MIGFIYFIPYVAEVENEVSFQNYDGVFQFAGLLSMLIFNMLSATMFARFVVEDYSGKRATLLFSYPVKKSKIFLAKVLLVLIFTLVAKIIATASAYLIFGFTESISPIVVQDVMSVGLIMEALKNLMVTALALGVNGILAMRIGFNKKSTSTTLIAALILSATYGHFIFNLVRNASTIVFLLSIIILSIVAKVIILMEFSRKINKMEA